MPLGLPVVPLVYRMYSRSSASIGSGSHSVDWPATRSWYQTSRPSRERVLAAGPPDGDHVLDRRAVRDRVVRVLLERDDLAAAVRAVGGDEDLRLRVVDAVLQRLGGEPAEHDRVRRADPRAGEHGHRELGHHAEVDGDPVALRDAEGLQRVGEPADLLVQLAVGDHARVAGLPLPV